MTKHEKGISPIVGTILLIAITVTLAAVIAVIVGRLGAPTAPPSVVLGVSAEDNADNENRVVITIEHRGGDDIPTDEIIVKAEDKNNDMVEVTIAWGNDAVFNVGESYSGGYGYGEPCEGKKIKVQVIHSPTNQILWESDRVTIK